MDSFVDELQKIARVERKHVSQGVPITYDLEELKKKIQPGDIFLTKKTDPEFFSFSTLIRYAQGLGPKNEWTHSGIVGPDKSAIHSYDKIIKKDGKLTVQPGTNVVSKHKFDLLDRLGRDVYVLRPKNVSKERRLQAANNAEKLLKTKYYDKGGKLTMLPSKRGPIKEDLKEVKEKGLICTTVPTLSYAKIDFGNGKSRTRLMPKDYLKAKSLTPVLAYSGKDPY